MEMTLESIKTEAINQQVAIYCRLSKEDDNKGDEDSKSIKTQKAMLTDYVKQHGWSIFRIYSDDGFSGLHAENRPAFQEMVRDIKKGLIDIVITKDLSRLGRNYTDSGVFTEEFLPKYGVRYISVNDGIDTMEEYNAILPFMNVMNEFYSRDVSKKISSGYRTRAKQGKFTGTIAPIGYIKNPEDPHVLIPDPETDWIVRKIFDWAASGLGARAIQGRLRKEKIPCPSWWNRQRGTRNVVTVWEKEYPEEGRFIWDITTIQAILRNPVYLGHMASQKANYKFKIGYISEKARDEWIWVMDTHEPIIDKEVYEQAQQRDKIRKRRCKTGFDNIFVGLLKCPDCDRAMHLGINHTKNQERFYTCGTYNRFGKTFCSQHKIMYTALYEVVLRDIRYHAESVFQDEEAVIKALTDNSEIEKNEEIERHKSEAKELERRYNELQNMVTKLYEDFMKGKIKENNFDTLLDRAQKEQEDIEKRLNTIKICCSGEENTREDDVHMWMDLIKKYRGIEELDREILNELIETIYIYEKEVDESGSLTQQIDIHYNFIGNSDNLIFGYDC